MTAPPAGAVTYTGLPISSGGAHSLGRMPRRVAYERTMSFLATCTELVDPVECWFLVVREPQMPPLGKLERELERRFGSRLGRPWVRRDRLVVPEQRVGDALDFLDEIDPQPTNPWGMAPIWFWVTARFRILDPATGQPIPGQDPERFHGVEYEGRVPLGSSGLGLILHNGAQLGLELCIPDGAGDLVGRVAPWLQQRLPMRLSPKHWRAWTPTKSGSFKARRMPSPV